MIIIMLLNVGIIYPDFYSYKFIVLMVESQRLYKYT